MEDLITVVINVYNGENYIQKCLESVLNQTYKDLEILIINDGSTDNTLNICESYKDERIRIINQENMGLSLARNVGIDEAKGEYLYFVDCDDFIEHDVIEHLYGLCKKYNTLIASCRTLDIYDYNYAVKNKNEEVQVLSGIDMLKKVLLSKERAGSFWNKLFKKEVLNDIRFEDRWINDIVVVYKIFLSLDRIAYSNRIKYYYLIRSGSITGTRNEERSIDLYKAAIERHENIKEIYPNLIENDVCLISKILILYIEDKPKLQKFLEEQNAIGLVRRTFSWKIFFNMDVNLKLKAKMLLFLINPKIYKKVAFKYKKNHCLYKM